MGGFGFRHEAQEDVLEREKGEEVGMHHKCPSDVGFRVGHERCLRSVKLGQSGTASSAEGEVSCRIRSS